MQDEAATSTASSSAALKTNHTSTLPPEHFAKLYAENGLEGGHVIKLGPRNDQAAREALAAWPDHLQVGGGITLDNAAEWLDPTRHARAGKIIVTSYLFPSAEFSMERLLALEKAVGREKLVVDLSCRRTRDAATAGAAASWKVAMNRWQDLTNFAIEPASLTSLAEHCSEFLVHAADVEGLCGGIDEQLVSTLGSWLGVYHRQRPGFGVTYAGGARHVGDMELVDQLSNGTVDLTFGSALDIFGGSGVSLVELVEWNEKAGEKA